MEPTENKDYALHMERVKERTLDNRFNGLAGIIASLSGYNITEDKVIQDAMNRENALNEYFKNLPEKDQMVTLQDLMDPSVRANLPFITPEVMESIASIMSVTRSLKAFDIIPRSNQAADVVMFRLCNKVMQGMVRNLFIDITDMIQKQDTSNPVFDMIYDALKDVIERGPLNFKSFCINNGLDEEDEYAVYKHSERVEEETMELLNKMFAEPVTGNFLAAPHKYKEVIDELKAIAPVSEEQWVNDLTPEAIYSPATQVYIEENWKDQISADQFATVQKIINDYIDANTAELTEAVHDPQTGAMVRPPMRNYNSLSLATVVLHALARASEELYNPEKTIEDFSDSTEYVLDGVSRVLWPEITDDLAEVGDLTAYKLLSCVFARFNTVFTASIAQHVRDTQMSFAINKIATIFNDYTLETLHNSPSETKDREEIEKEINN